MPVVRVICERASISRDGLAYWIKKSQAGQLGCGDGFDLVIDGTTRRFHEWYYDAFQDGVDLVEEAGFKLGMGKYKEVLTFKGRVQYQIDPELEALGFEGSEAWLRDENGKPIPETIEKLDPDMTRFILKAHRPDTYVNTQKIDVTHKGGVLVVGAKISSETFEKKFIEKQDQPPPIDVQFEVLDEKDPSA